MSSQQHDGTKAISISNRAQLAETGEIREARELWALGYTKHGWVCVDEKCRIRMVPIAWERPNEKGRFCRNDGTPFERPPHFRAEPDHKLGCKASYPIGDRDRPSPEYHIGPPTDYPHRIILFSTQSFGRDLKKQAELEQGEEDTQRQHARWVRSIREACEYYVDHPSQHWRPLRVDRCPGTTYGECFVRFGAGDQRGAGKNWIFYDEIRFRDWVELDVEPIRLKLLGAVHRNPRTLIIHTTHWPTEHRKEFRSRLKAALKEARAAYNAGRPERPWIFAFARERTFDELEVEAVLQPGVDVLVRAMPQLSWRYRPTHRFAVTSRRQPPYSQTQPPPAGVGEQHVGRSNIEVVTQPSGWTASEIAKAIVELPCIVADNAQLEAIPEATSNLASEEAPLDEPLSAGTVRQSDGTEISPRGGHEPALGSPKVVENNGEALCDITEHELRMMGAVWEPARALTDDTLLMPDLSTAATQWTDESRVSGDQEPSEGIPPRATSQSVGPYGGTKEPIPSTVESVDGQPELVDAIMDKTSVLSESAALKQVIPDQVGVAAISDRSFSAIRKKPKPSTSRRMFQRITDAVKAWCNI